MLSTPLKTHYDCQDKTRYGQKYKDSNINPDCFQLLDLDFLVPDDFTD